MAKRNEEIPGGSETSVILKPSFAITLPAQDNITERCEDFFEKNGQSCHLLLFVWRLDVGLDLVQR
jgi:hypothetical protein